MQAENYKYQPDQQFTDHSWEEMKKMLDKEMPVEKKRKKRFFWIFFLYLLFGVLVVGSTWAVYSKLMEGEVRINESALMAQQKEEKPPIIESPIDKINTQEKTQKTAPSFSKKEVEPAKVEITIVLSPATSSDSI